MRSGDLVLDLSGLTLDAALRLSLLGVLGTWAAWWALGLLVALVDPRTAARLGPPLLRAVLVGGVVAATVAPAHARSSAPVGALDGLPLPELPVTTTVPALPATTTEASPPRAHVVAPGESLWSIVRDRSPGASDADLATAVVRWHAANRGVIGPDPDLIQPGQRLVPPGAS